MSALVAAGWRRLLGRGVIVVVAAAVLALGLVRMNHVEASRSGVPTVFIGDSITHADTDEFTDLPGKRSWLRYVVTDDRTPWRYLANTAISGQTLGQMAERFDRDVLARGPQGVVIMGGTNDLRLGVPIERSMADLRSMVERAHAAGARVWVISPPPLQFDDWGSLQPLIDAERALAAELEVPFVEHDGRVGQGRWSSDDLTSDGVHPTRDGAQALGASVLDAVD